MESRSVIPEEIWYEIMLRIPAKCLIKCTAVCKSWKTMINSSAFIDTHLRRQYGNRHLLLMKPFSNNLYLEDSTTLATDLAEYISPPVLHDSGGCYEMTMGGTCNGVICSARSATSGGTAVIWNPSVRRYLILPGPATLPTRSHQLQVHSLVYDYLTNDCKVLKIVHSAGTIDSVEIYSLRSGSWKSLCATTAGFPAYWEFVYYFMWVFMNNSLHWVQSRDEYHQEYVIVFFDFGTESFGEMALPEPLQIVDSCCSFFKYEESLAFVKIDNEEDRLQLWVMKEYGVQESWAIVFDIPRPLRMDCVTAHGSKSPDELVLTGFGYKITTVTVNMKTKEVKHHGVHGGFNPLKMDHVVESLVILDHPDAISY